jgi:hypothetical protein
MRSGILAASVKRADAIGEWICRIGVATAALLAVV